MFFSFFFNNLNFFFLKKKIKIQILNSEIRNKTDLLTIKNKESISIAEKQHMKINLFKFIESAIEK